MFKQVAEVFETMNFKEKRILVAVSSGVDSMVLLHILQRLTTYIDCQIAVAHVNHQLREESQDEAIFLASYCQKYEIPYFEKTWENPPTFGIEAAARQFRYQFFSNIMESENYPVLVTAHHADDQLETMLMKMIRDGKLSSSMGIKMQQEFSIGQLIRPFLSFSKEQIYQYARQYQVPYFEDGTNQSMDFQRNRIRNQIIPTMKKENSKILEHFQQLSRELQLANQWIVNKQQQLFYQLVVSEKDCYKFNVSDYDNLKESEGYFFLDYLFRKINVQENISISQKHLEKAMELLQKSKATWTIDISPSWKIYKEYQWVSIQKKHEESSSKDENYLLEKNHGFFLSEKEWIGWIDSNRQEMPEKVESWNEFSINIPEYFSGNLKIRRRRAGDKIWLTSTLRKKVSRYFIDQKIPRQQRDQSWLVLSEENVIGILPFTFSYLSIGKETDKIHYILLYKYLR